MRGVFSVFRRDVERHHSQIRESGVWAMVVYRMGVLATKSQPGPIQETVRALRGGLALALRLLTRTSLAADLKAGEGLFFVHASNVTMGSGVVLGSNVVIMQDVTIGPDYAGSGVPRIGDDVFIGAGATILGAVTVGNGAAIGSNSLVITDVPAGAFVIGVPAKVIRWGRTESAPATPRRSPEPA